MNFSSHVLDKSVPQWKHQNLEYDKLKKAIMRHTRLETLDAMFKEQFQNINLFVSLKIKEISTRIMSVEASFDTTTNNAEGTFKFQDRILSCE